MTVSRRLRFEILRRDGHTCRYCGAKAPDVTLTVDHVIPVALGGGDDPTNLVTACSDCNSGKSSIAPDAALVEDVDAAALLFAKAMEKATETHRMEIEGTTMIVDDFDKQWRTWTNDSGPMPRPKNWRTTVEGYIWAGLLPEDLSEMLVVAMNSNAANVDLFRYFCGCCRNRLADRQERARQMIEDGNV